MRLTSCGWQEDISTCSSTTPASPGRCATFTTTPPETDISEVLPTNVAGYVRVMHAFLPLLEASTDPRIVNVSSGLGSFALFHDLDRLEATAGTPLCAASKAAINMLTARYARLLPHIRINIADPGMTVTDLSGHRGHSVQDGTDAIIAFAFADGGGPSGTYPDRDGELPW